MGMTEVTKNDRVAAAAYYHSAGGNPNIARLIREGKKDEWFRVQAFARHRAWTEADARDTFNLLCEMLSEHAGKPTVEGEAYKLADAARAPQPPAQRDLAD